MHILLNLAKVYTHTAKLVKHISLALSMLGRLCYFGVPSGGIDPLIFPSLDDPSGH